MAKRTYTVTAPSAVLGNEPGTVFDADLDSVQEERLLASGALSVGDTQPSLNDLSRDELNELALEKGVLNPDNLPSKKAVITAIEDAEAEESAEAPAEDGETPAEDEFPVS